MRSRPFALVGLSFCIPVAALCAVGVWFLAVQVPKIATSERSRETREYRTVAVALAGNPESARWHAGRERGGRERGKVTRPDGTRAAWGFLAESDGRILVWTVGRSPDEIVGVRVAAADIVSVSTYLYVGVPTVMLFCLLLTVFCLVFFWRSIKARDDFLSATAHDLTTPLVGLRHLVGRDDAEAKVVVERMFRLVANLKDFLRLGGCRASPSREGFAIGDAFDEAYALFAADYAEEHSGPVSVLGDRTLRVCADRTLVVQILWNLLGNDLKYAAPFGSVSVRFALSEGRDDRVVVEFADEGPGLKPRERRRAFDRYYRTKTVLASGKGGFGIGLCTAREFARAMGGALSVRANAPKGCVFALSLPLVR